MKTIFDILRLFVKQEFDEYSKSVGGYDISLSKTLINIKRETDKWWFCFHIRNHSRCVAIDKPDNVSYDTLLVSLDILDDLFTMDDSQIILTYGKIYPDYLSGDLSELYEEILNSTKSN